MIAITFVVVWIGTFLNQPANPLSGDTTGPMPLYGILIKFIGNNHFLRVIFSFSLVAIMAFILTNFNTTNFFINERTYLPALIYILIGGILPQCQLMNPVLPASLFLMLAIIRLMDGYRITGIAYCFFDAGFLISTGSLFYANLIWFGLLLIIGIILLRTGSLGEIGISILGLITPYLITFGMYYVLGEDLVSLLSLVISNLLERSEAYVISRLEIITLIFTGIMVVISLIYLFMLMNTKKIKSRKTFFLLIWTFLISLGICIVLPSATTGMIWLISIPSSYFMTHFFVFVKKKLIPEIFFSVFVILVLMIQILMWSHQ